MTCSPPDVLVVDDDADIRQCLCELLEGEGYQVSPAVNGADALAQLRLTPSPCLILLDLSMPVMDGLQFRERQRQDPALASIPVVVITAGGVLARTALSDTPVLKKPFDLDDLFRTVRSYC